MSNGIKLITRVADAHRRILGVVEPKPMRDLFGTPGPRPAPALTVNSPASLPHSTLTEARSAITSWKKDYNHHRPHSALGNMPPAEFAIKTTLEKQAVLRPEVKLGTLH
jgi:hypothetical protein